jgi:hypothetical protein
MIVGHPEVNLKARKGDKDPRIARRIEWYVRIVPFFHPV